MSSEARSTAMQRRRLQHDRRSARERGYTRTWEKARRVYLGEHPLCVTCRDMGRHKAATVVNHRIPHRGDMHLFWDQSNWQAVCKTCHDGHIQSKERRGITFRTDVDARGVPTDPNHPWNKIDR